jgi:septum formation inhibitor-activating ATPase MinD
MMRVIEVSARKGGVGTSTVACSIALALGKTNPERVLLIDTSANSDDTLILGLAPSSDEQTYKDITIVNAPFSEVSNLRGVHYDFVVIDTGLLGGKKNTYFDYVPFRVAVVRNSYLSLRAEAQETTHTTDAVVAIVDAQDALTAKDVGQVLRQKDTTIVDFDNRTSRAIDAGLYGHRDTLWEWAVSFTQRFIPSHELS